MSKPPNSTIFVMGQIRASPTRCATCTTSHNACDTAQHASWPCSLDHCVSIEKGMVVLTFYKIHYVKTSK